MRHIIVPAFASPGYIPHVPSRIIATTRQQQRITKREPFVYAGDTDEIFIHKSFFSSSSTTVVGDENLDTPNLICWFRGGFVCTSTRSASHASIAPLVR